ncbi:MAG: hypothetical protein ABI601_14685 [bacterium]
MTERTADSLFTTRAMTDAFSPRALVRCMLRFEAALARAEARAGVVPESAADAIAAACDPEAFDADGIIADTERAGTPAERNPVPGRLQPLVLKRRCLPPNRKVVERASFAPCRA